MREKLASIVILILSVFASAAEPLAHVSILQTTDLHGYILQDTETPGVLKLASVIRREYLPGKTLLVDCGDTFEGSFEAAATQGAIMLPIFSKLPYDIWIPGNHDFDWGLKRLSELSSQLKCRKLAANIPMEGFTAWTMFEREGVKIAVLGISSPYLAKWLWGDKFAGLEAKGIEESVEKAMPEILRARPDIIILAIHAGKFAPERLGQADDNLQALVRKHPEIDLILGGHTHQQEPGEKLGRTTWFAQAGQHAETLLKVSIDFDKAKGRIAHLESQLLKPDAENPDPELSSLLKAELERADTFGDSEVANLKRKLGPANKRKGSENTLTQLLCQALAEATGAKASFHGAHNQMTLGPGAVTERDLHRVIPYENSVGTLELTPSQCRAIIEEQAAVQDKTKRLSAWGLNFKLSPEGRLDGPITLDDGSAFTDENVRIKVAFSGYDLASGGGRFPVLAQIASGKDAKASDAGISTRDALRKALTRR